MDLSKLMCAAILSAIATCGFATAACADLISLTITPNGNAGGVQALPEPVLDGGFGFPCATCGPFPNIPTFGFTSPATVDVGIAGLYRFFFEGAGNADAINTFTIEGQTFTANPPGATGAGSTPAGFSIDVSLPVGVMPFTFTSSTGCTISDGAASPAAGCDYLISLGAIEPHPAPEPIIRIGFSDGAAPNDADFQDLVVYVLQVLQPPEEVPEPASLVLLGIGLLGFVLLCRRKAV